MRVKDYVFGAALFALVGAGLGSVIGLLIKKDPPRKNIVEKPAISCVYEVEKPFEGRICEEPPTQSLALDDRVDGVGEKCRELIPGHNDTDGKRINLVFVGVNYEVDDLVSKSLEGVFGSGDDTGLMHYAPFWSNFHRFNFWYVDDTRTVDMYYEDKAGNNFYADEAEPHIKDLSSMCRLPNKGTVGIVNWGFRAHANRPTYSMEDINIFELELSDIEEIRDSLQYYSMDQCLDAVNYCANLDFDGSGEIDEKDEKMLYGNIPDARVIEEVCSFYEEVPSCESFEYDGKRLNNEYLALFRKEAYSSHAFEFCPAMVSISGSTDPEKALCSIVSGGSIDFGMVQVAYNDTPSVLVHELSHLLFGLEDEYENEEKVPDIEKSTKAMKKDGMNCYVAKSWEECMENAPWSGLIETYYYAGCYKGCGYIGEEPNAECEFAWRSVEDGLMRSGNKIAPLGAWNEKLGCMAIYVATGGADGICVEYLYDTEAATLPSITISGSATDEE